MNAPSPGPALRPGPRNDMTDIAGLRVGQAQDDRLKTGVTVLTADAPFTAAVHVMGGAPGTRETDLLTPGGLVRRVDALVLSGGSAFGLAAATGAASALAERGRGFLAGGYRVPIVPAAVLFDLGAGGASCGGETPHTALGRTALDAALDAPRTSAPIALGSHGAGTGARTARLKGGIGSASCTLPGGGTVAALVAVNPVGCACAPGSGRFWAAPFEQGDEFGGRGVEDRAAPVLPATKLMPGAQTTLAIVATDLALDQAETQRMAMAAQDGMARALLPSHTPFDGDLVFGVSTAGAGIPDAAGRLWLGHGAGVALARAIARAVYAARPAPGDDRPCWCDLYG
ncbi:P1 family peptidase [Profundibacterium mesophilum]|uniref:L-aminopeptidaseD-esterase Amino acid transport and metabolism Secondary metabolites biosynthesis n=1 Tax=Profundibacterium mesophilum KAUST100406-0324 TaxID=1037889 RepID=A0A921NSG8_9RHOB|nr:P1 family peptidase [Profundibacterium mesophilum]KAF0674553.1 L-aminopeptidaseD-esterase Amino acid transport and metabolism Secondary metabolites biosynthesis [Profundibacterium mesophilum KAUST100406-0324]